MYMVGLPWFLHRYQPFTNHPPGRGNGALASDRIKAVETGGCPHAAIRAVSNHGIFRHQKPARYAAYASLPYLVNVYIWRELENTTIFYRYINELNAMIFGYFWDNMGKIIAGFHDSMEKYHDFFYCAMMIRIEQPMMWGKHGKTMWETADDWEWSMILFMSAPFSWE